MGAERALHVHNSNWLLSVVSLIVCALIYTLERSSFNITCVVTVVGELGTCQVPRAWYAYYIYNGGILRDGASPTSAEVP